MVNQVEELQHGLEEQEREAVEAASQLERQQFLSVARALQPVLEQQAVLACNHLASTSNLSDLITSLTHRDQIHIGPCGPEHIRYGYNGGALIDCL